MSTQFNGRLFIGKAFSDVTVEDCKGIDAEALQKYIDDNYVPVGAARRKAEEMAEVLSRPRRDLSTI